VKGVGKWYRKGKKKVRTSKKKREKEDM
jgi:hypothetical protein